MSAIATLSGTPVRPARAISIAIASSKARRLPIPVRPSTRASSRASAAPRRIRWRWERTWLIRLWVIQAIVDQMRKFARATAAASEFQPS